jgi:hypothetical protein
VVNIFCCITFVALVYGRIVFIRMENSFFLQFIALVARLNTNKLFFYSHTGTRV